MENKNLHTNNDTFLAQWLEGELSDTELKNRISEQDYTAFVKLRKALEVSMLKRLLTIWISLSPS